jgi:hypothetical protein
MSVKPLTSAQSPDARLGKRNRKRINRRIFFMPHSSTRISY